MKVTDVYFITREDDSEYSKIVFDTKHYAVLENGETRFKVFTPHARKASYHVTQNAITAILDHYKNT